MNKEQVTSVCNKCVEVKTQVAQSLATLYTLSAQLPVKPSDSFQRVQQMLDRTEFCISVCGEVSQGKSQFINALIGKELLPVDQHSTTSQIFRISQSNVESFSLVFTDGSTAQLDSAETAVKYGSALNDALVSDPIVAGKTIKWIEIKTPMRYLPSGVILYDTPGLGSLHYSHACITHKCLSMSDAVMFLRAPRSPLERIELDFLKKVYDYTDNVLFIQTKADMYKDDVRNEIANRDCEILSKELDSKIQEQYKRKVSFHFYPVSSSMLLNSIAYTNDRIREIHYQNSYFEDLLQALKLLIFRTTNYSPSCTACYEAALYQVKASDMVERELQALKNTDANSREELQRKLEDNKRRFEEYWGPNSYHIRELKDKFTDVIQRASKYTENIFAPTSPIKKEYVDRINETFPKSLSEVQTFAEQISADLSERMADEWSEIVRDTQQKVMDIYSDFQMNLNTNLYTNISVDTSLPVEFRPQSLLDKIRNVTGSVFESGKTDAIIAGISIAAGIILWPFTGGTSLLIGKIVALLAGADTVWKGFSTFSGDNKKDLEKAKKSVLRALDNGFEELRQKFYGCSLSSSSPVDSFFNDLKKSVMQQCESEIQHERENLENERKQLTEALKMNDSQSKVELTEKEDLFSKLKEIENELEKSAKILDSIKAECVF